MSSPSTGGTEGSSPASSPASGTSLAMAAPKYGTLVPNRIFVGGISPNTSEAELAQLFSNYGHVKATKIIADRAGVSKGYGFVTFETEEEAKRLHQDSECIVLKERKLNIAPAIKKQPFNRSFDNGSGSPPTVPTSTLYYANGMGLTYQNGVTFYNAAAPTPGAPVAPTTDPATIYQAAAGVFGPQGTVGHQTFAPMMYPCPAPSLYMPQQYQYPPMPYEPFYQGTPTASGSPYIFPTGASHNTSSGGSGSGSNGNGTANNSSSSHPAAHPSSMALPPPPPQTHFYTPAGPPQTHHHPIQGAPAPQDHVYYSFTTGPPLPPQSHTALGLTSDQQLLFYTTDATCQQPNISSDSQNTQEDTHSTSSHSEPHNETQGIQASGPMTSLVPLMPVKYQLSGQYSNYQAMVHAPSMPGTHTNGLNDSEEVASPMQACRAIVYPTLFIHPGGAHYPGASGAGASLLPTPPAVAHQASYDAAKMVATVNSKSSHYHTKMANSCYSGIAKSHSIAANSTFNAPKYNSNSTHNNNTTNYPNSSSSYRLSNYHHSYGRRGGATSGSGSSNSSSSWLPSPKSGYGGQQQQQRNYSHSNYYRKNGEAPVKKSEPDATETPAVDDGPKPASAPSSGTAGSSLTSPPPAAPAPAFSCANNLRSVPILSSNPPSSQVQYFPSVQNRYPQTFLSMSRPTQRQRGGATVAQIGNTARKQSNDKHSAAPQRQPKHKTSNGKIGAEEPDARMPITPPGTPSSHAASDQSQLNDACHNLQALGL